MNTAGCLRTVSEFISSVQNKKPEPHFIVRHVVSCTQAARRLLRSRLHGHAGCQMLIPYMDRMRALSASETHSLSHQIKNVPFLSNLLGQIPVFRVGSTIYGILAGHRLTITRRIIEPADPKMSIYASPPALATKVTLSPCAVQF